MTIPKGSPLSNASLFGEPKFFDPRSRFVELATGQRILLPKLCKSHRLTYTFEMLKHAISDTKASLLITGETGTGKEMINKCAIKFSGADPKKCHSINCAGLNNEQLAESELFGHKKGAFTGADGNRAGIIEGCQNGILFLDEIGWLPKLAQAKLLRFMETGEYRPVGEDKPLNAKNVRILAATNQPARGDISPLIPDLVERFNHEITLPALRDRAADAIWLLGEPGFLGDCSVFTGISLKTIIGVLCGKWAGNIRELSKYCKLKKDFRHLEKLVPGEKPNILDDETLARNSGYLDWSTFSIRVLREHQHEAQEEYALLKALLYSIAQWKGRHFRPDTFATMWYSPGFVLPIGNLLDELTKNHGDHAFPLIALDPSVQKVLSESPHYDSEEQPFSFNGLSSTLIGALMELKCSVGLYQHLKKTMEPDQTFSSIGDIDWVYAGAATRALDELRATINQPSDFQHQLNQSGLSAKDQKICSLCNRGYSCKEIAKRTNGKKSTISSRLREIRESHLELASGLPKAKPGRKKPA